MGLRQKINDSRIGVYLDNTKLGQKVQILSDEFERAMLRSIVSMMAAQYANNFYSGFGDIEKSFGLQDLRSEHMGTIDERAVHFSEKVGEGPKADQRFERVFGEIIDYYWEKVRKHSARYNPSMGTETD